MSIDRKYRQRGYMDSYREEKSERKEKSQKPPKAGGPRWQQQAEAPRAPKMPGRRDVSRCAHCGTVLTALMDPLGQCPQCGFELHSCKQCTHFDPGSRFECTQAIPERIPQKEALNECTFFHIRTVSERETSSTPARPDDARKAFENLFKK